MATTAMIKTTQLFARVEWSMNIIPTVGAIKTLILQI
jgi:hypothetical protein